MKLKLALCLLLFVPLTPVSSNQIIQINSTVSRSVSGKTVGEVNDDQWTQFDLDKLQLKKGNYLYGVITISANITEDAFSAIRYKVYLEFSVDTFIDLVVDDIEYDEQFVNGSEIRFVKKVSDLITFEKEDIYITAYIISGSNEYSYVSLNYFLQLVEVPQLDPILLEKDSEGNTTAYPSSYTITGTSFLKSFGKSYVFLPHSFETENLKDSISNITFSHYKVNVEILIKIDRLDYGSLDQLEVNVKNRIVSEFLGELSFITCKFKKLWYDDILTMKLKYQGHDAVIEIMYVKVQFPSVYDTSLEDPKLDIPRKTVITVSYIALVSIAWTTSMSFWKEQFRNKIKYIVK